ncbi:hypothetical protein [Terasakiella pusilla]|uniref:hypothetical protein n=1 Tax=Terasakiella pusilla TaxID=64973 RepID=UPI003AA80299
MPNFEITSPEGKKYRITAPEGATKDDAFQYFMDNFQQEKPVQSVADAEQDSLNKMKSITDPQSDIWRGLNVASAGFKDSALETIAAVPNAVSAGMRAAGLNTPEDGFYSKKLKEGWQKYADVVNEPVKAVMGGIGPDELSGTADKIAYGAGRGAGDAASIMVPAAAVAKGTKAGTLTNEAAKVLAGQQGVQLGAGAVGGSVGEATNNPYLGTAAAVATGVAGGAPAAARGASQTSRMIKSAPTTKQLAQQGSRLFDKAKGSGAIIKPDSYANFLAKAENKLLSAGADPQVHPKLSAVMGALTKRIGNEMDIQDLQNARRVAANAAASRESDERRLGKMLVGEIDDFISGLGTKDLISGNMGSAADDLMQARSIWAKMKKSEMIDDVVSSAKKQASGYENGLRIGIRKILNNPNSRRAFSAEEIKAMEKVVEGTATANVLKKIGKLGFGAGQQSNFLGGSIGIGAGGMLAGPVGSMAAPLVGYGAQKGAEAATSRSLQLARALVAQGAGAMGPRASSDPKLQQLASILMAREKDRAMSPQPMPVR